MKKVIVFALVWLIAAGFTARAQTTKLGSAGNRANYGTANPRPAIGSGSTGSTTVDGTNGSATNDGASGQSGSPAPLPAASADQKTTKRVNSRKMKNTNRISSTSSRTVTL